MRIFSIQLVHKLRGAGQLDARLESAAAFRGRQRRRNRIGARLPLQVAAQGRFDIRGDRASQRP